ncbi:histidine triad (HIT) family protein [Gracilibacillus ureilyticus]|uniref:Histidine triad (HIT) family protein n=1 Tax=Gracilibacillus ureilyticus TaxID=531814 RepID=A0A1H9SME6_9BACI|nr:HIT family protein [Gracilibacillus ureilyticus]SER85459.1 histidine triad (HIT) family protein [Gracilibacillus ureilyticus]
MTVHNDCIFCKIIAGDIPSAKVYEDDHVYAFLDISQITKGHTLIISKTHSKDIYETDDETAAKLFSRVPKIARALKESFQPNGINILNNNEAPAGQSVFHLHLHIIPRYGKEDGFGTKWITHEKEYSSNDLAEIAGSINKQIR